MIYFYYIICIKNKMTNHQLEQQIIHYFNSEKFTSKTYLTVKNISRNISQKKRKVFIILEKSEKFTHVNPNIVGSCKHRNNLNVYKVGDV